jgi:aryl-alcohol dehydrogenase-like predicted oxidoreductase
MQKYNRKICVWSLLGGGMLADSPLGKIERRNSLYEVPHGNKFKDRPEELENIHKGIKEISKELNCTMAEFSIAWGLKHPDISTAIMGWKKPVEIDESLNAISKIPMITKDVEQKVNSLLNNRPKGEFDWKTMQFSFEDKRWF